MNAAKDNFNAAAGPGPDVVRETVNCIVGGFRAKVSEYLDEHGPGLVNAVYYCRDEGMSLLQLAAFYGRRDICADLIDRGADINAGDPSNGVTALEFAAAHDDTDVMQLLIDRGADVNQRREKGCFPLIGAVRAAILQSSHDGLAATRLLIARGADVNQRTDAGVTVLMLAAETGQTGLCYLLFNLGADVGLRDNEGLDAIGHARRGGWGATAAALKQAIAARDEAIQENEVRNFGAGTGVKKPIITRGPLRLLGIAKS
jgi:ankyrin repeat protein